MPHSGALEAANLVRDGEGGTVVLVLNKALDVCPPGVELVASFERSVVPREIYFIYADRRTSH